MPLENYVKLKSRKKEMIQDAIDRCLLKYDYDQLTINEMAEEAGISRGSFYLYFSDKNDAIKELVAVYLAKTLSIFKATILGSSGDFFKGVIEAFNQIKIIFTNEHYKKLCTNMKFFNSVIMKIFYSNEYSETRKELVGWLLENTVEGKTYINTKEKMSNCIDLVLGIFSHTIIKYIIDNDYKNTEKNVKEQLAIVKQGFKLS